jgi:hypothetical protein
VNEFGVVRDGRRICCQSLIVDSGGAEQCSEYCGMLIESTDLIATEVPALPGLIESTVRVDETLGGYG